MRQKKKQQHKTTEFKPKHEQKRIYFFFFFLNFVSLRATTTEIKKNQLPLFYSWSSASWSMKLVNQKQFLTHSSHSTPLLSFHLQWSSFSFVLKVEAEEKGKIHRKAKESYSSVSHFHSSERESYMLFYSWVPARPKSFEIMSTFFTHKLRKKREESRARIA